MLRTVAPDESTAKKRVLPSVRFQAYTPPMPDIAKWVSLLLITVVAVSPIFEVFDQTDGLAQSTSDFALYALCLFCLLTFTLSRTVIILHLTSFRKSILGAMHRPVGDAPFSAILGTADRGLFLTLHDLRI
jgi:hypothetical protein